ncbi:hypothetical protein NC652_004891 [Populus alba x Populus x berolinensis]|nr:hypothetical protein NC652_004891 [Populus alba x Populus x berolinensis]
MSQAVHLVTKNLPDLESRHNGIPRSVVRSEVFHVRCENTVMDHQKAGVSPAQEFLVERKV